MFRVAIVVIILFAFRSVYAAEVPSHENNKFKTAPVIKTLLKCDKVS